MSWIETVAVLAADHAACDIETCGSPDDQIGIPLIAAARRLDNLRRLADVPQDVPLEAVAAAFSDAYSAALSANQEG